MVALGHRYTFFSVGLPDEGLLAALRQHAALVDRWECVLPLQHAPELAQRAGPWVRETGLRLLLANLRSGMAGNTRKQPGQHDAAPGFLVDEAGVARDLLRGPLAGVAAGLCFGLPRAEALEPALQTLSLLAQDTGAIVTATLSLMGAGPNEAHTDDADTRALVAQALALAQRHLGVDLQLDTFMDIDRGYYVRHGLVDRRSNWRPAGLALARARAAQIEHHRLHA
jgi:hypothetical protein